MKIDNLTLSLDEPQIAAVVTNLDQLVRWELQLVRRGDDAETHQITADLVQQLIEQLAPPDPEPAGESGNEPEGEGGRRWMEIKTIKGRQYKYWRWYEGGKKRSKYIGRA